MNLILYTCALVAGIVLLIALVRAFLSPLRALFRLLFRTALGFAGLILLDHFGVYIGFTLGVNLVNALVIGVLGLPGFALLLMLRWLCLL